MPEIRLADKRTLTRLLLSLPNIHLPPELIWKIWEIASRRLWNAFLRNYPKKRLIFGVWEKATDFLPKSNAKPDEDLSFSCPLSEYKCYHRRHFIRERHCLGVTFATSTMVDGKCCTVVWVKKPSGGRGKAMIYESVLWNKRMGEKGKSSWNDRQRHTSCGTFVLSKVLNRQDDPFATWMQHLGGADVVRSEATSSFHPRRSAEKLFRDLVCPLYGHHPLANGWARGPARDHPSWAAIKDASYAVVGEDTGRLQWRCLSD